jgi:hypothetical protein
MVHASLRAVTELDQDPGGEVSMLTGLSYTLGVMQRRYPSTHPLYPVWEVLRHACTAAHVAYVPYLPPVYSVEEHDDARP